MPESIELTRVAFLYAMEAEARPLIEALALTPERDFGDPRMPFRYYRGIYRGGIDLLVAVSGKCQRFGVDNIGTEPATLNAYLVCRQFAPDLLVNLGTAGGFHGAGANIGDVYLGAEAFRFHDRRIAIPGFEQYGVGDYPALSIEGLARAIGLKEGVITTGNSLDHHARDFEIMLQNGAAVKEMEAAAIAWVAHELKIPFLAVKAITDLVDSDRPAADQFLENLAASVKRLNEKALALLAYFESTVRADED